MLRSLRVPGGSRSGSRSCLAGTPRTFTATLPGVLAARVPMTWSPRRSCSGARHELSQRLVDRLRAKADRARLLDEILGVLADPDIPRGLPDPRGFLSPSTAELSWTARGLWVAASLRVAGTFWC